ncbi:MAG: hypothetical protein ACXVBV_22435, partial [Isosphaeraceae bacterium]
GETYLIGAMRGGRALEIWIRLKPTSSTRIPTHNSDHLVPVAGSVDTLIETDSRMIFVSARPLA